MNPMRIASWFLLLTMGVISAIANPIDPPAIGAVPPQSQSSKDQSDNAGEVIPDKNWQKHPKIIAIRRIVNADNAEALRKASEMTSRNWRNA